MSTTSTTTSSTRTLSFPRGPGGMQINVFLADEKLLAASVTCPSGPPGHIAYAAAVLPGGVQLIADDRAGRVVGWWGTTAFVFAAEEAARIAKSFGIRIEVTN